MKWVKDDGGRQAAGFKGHAGDCALRALAIAGQGDYATIYQDLATFCESERPSKRRRGVSHPRTGIHSHTFRAYLEARGWTWVPTMTIGSGCKVHLRANELPTGRLIVCVSRHYCAMIDGVLHDTHDCTRGGRRCVYGYFRRAA